MNNFSKWKRTLFWFFYSPHHQLLQFPVNFLGRHHHFYFGGGQQRRSRLGQLVATTIKWQILYNSKEFINLPPGNLLLVNWVTFESWHFYKVIVILGWITTLLWLPNSMNLQCHGDQAVRGYFTNLSVSKGLASQSQPSDEEEHDATVVSLHVFCLLQHLHGTSYTALLM